MKVKYVLLTSLLALAVVLSGCGKEAPKEQKEEPSTQALQAYQEILKAAPAITGEHPELQDASFDDVQNREKFGEHYDQFMLADLNQDGIPELIASSTVNFRWIPISVYTFAEGKAVLLKDPLEGAANSTFEQCSTANGAYVTYLCAENHIHSVWRGMTPVGEAEENHAYALEGTALKAVDCPIREGDKTVSFFDAAMVNSAENAEAITQGSR